MLTSRDREEGMAFMQILNVLQRSRKRVQYGSARVWFPAETAMIRGLGGLKNRKMN